MSAAQKPRQKRTQTPRQKRTEESKQKPKKELKELQQEPQPGTNLVVLEGEVSSEPTVRDLPSGDKLVAFDVRVRLAEGPAQSLPVTWIGPDRERHRGTFGKLQLGKRCVVLGAMNRRFYQAKGGGLQSRVDLRAENVVVDSPARRRSAIARFLKVATS